MEVAPQGCLHIINKEINTLIKFPQFTMIYLNLPQFAVIYPNLTYGCKIGVYPLLKTGYLREAPPKENLCSFGYCPNSH